MSENQMLDFHGEELTEEKIGKIVDFFFTELMGFKKKRYLFFYERYFKNNLNCV